MDPLLIANGLSNFVISLSLTLFFLMIYGNEDGIVQKWNPINHWLLKLSLVGLICISAWNTVVNFGLLSVVLYTPTPIGEVIMHVALAGLFVWMFWFHKYHFMKVMEDHKRKAAAARRKRMSKTVTKTATKTQTQTKTAKAPMSPTKKRVGTR